MTILLVDAGNSRLKWSELQSRGKLSTQQALAYGDKPALASFLSLLDRYSPIEHITLVHVLTPLFVEGAKLACEEKGIKLYIASSQAHACGIISGYETPHLLGADRFVGMVAAHHLANQQACLVVDCGTAVTIDAVTAEGQHLGGVILPGLQLSADALIARAQNRLSLSLENPSVFADKTARAIGGGCLFGLIGAIEGICTRMQQAQPQVKWVKILTGGDASFLQTWLGESFQVIPDLLMQGLRFMTEQELCIRY